MKTTKILGFLFLVCIVSSLGVGTTKALTSSQYWGMSTGDVLYYRVTTNKTGSITVVDAKVVVTNVYNGSSAGWYYNFVNATTYVWNGNEWFLSYPDTWWAGINETHALLSKWVGSVQACLGFPNPAPLGWTITNISTVLQAISFYYGWGVVSSTIVGNKVTLANATESIILTYDAATGVCLNNTRTKIATGFYNSQVYLGEVDPYAKTEEPEENIAGYSPLALGLIIGLTTLIISKRIKNRKQ